MGLLQIPRGLSRTDYAPSQLAAGPADSRAPWAWAGLVQAHLFSGGSTFEAVRRRVENTGNPSYGFGRAGGGLTGGGVSFDDVLTGTSEATFVIFVSLNGPPTGNHGIVSKISPSNGGWAILADDSDFLTSIGNSFIFRDKIVGGTISNVQTTGEGTANRGLHCVVFTISIIGNKFEAWLNGHKKNSKAYNANLSGADGTTPRIGSQANGSFLDSASLPGAIHYVGQYNRALSDDEIRAISRDPFLAFRPRPLLVPVQGLSGGDPIAPTGIRQPAPQIPTATVTAATTVQPTGIYQAAPRIPQGALTATTTLQPDGITQPAPKIPQGGLTASTTLEPTGIRQPGPRIPQANVGSSVSLSPVGIRQPAPQVPRAGLTAVTMLEPVGIRQPSPQIPQAELPDSALVLTGIRQPAPRIPQAEVTAATTLNPTGIRVPGPSLPRLTFPAPIEPVVAIGAIIHAVAVRGPKVMQATATRGPKIIHATARRDV